MSVKIAWSGKHFGEEPPLTGNNKQGAGAIFFSHCHLHCVFCQNYQISQENLGQDYSAEALADIMLSLEKQGAININLVSPTLWWQPIKRAIMAAKNQGLKIPIVWNSNAYESPAILKEMAGLVDIYLPDFKYGDEATGLKYSGVKNYPKVAFKAIQEMLRQAGLLKNNKLGLAQSGVIVRHLILPNNVNNSLKALDYIARLEPKVHVSLMSQYYPLHFAGKYLEINRLVSQKEFTAVFNHLIELGLENGWVQEENSQSVLIPDFTKENPFFIT